MDKERFSQLGFELLGLSTQSRARLAALLIDSLADVDEEDEDYDRLWIQEAQRRLAEMRAGKTELVPVEDMIKDMKARLGH